MMRIEPAAWQAMVRHAEQSYPNECCGALLGVVENGVQRVSLARPLRNVYAGDQRDRYEVDPTELLAVDREARAQGLQLIGIYHSHPDADAYFSKTDLENSCPWFSFVVLAVKKGRVEAAGCFVPEADQRSAIRQELVLPENSRFCTSKP